MFFCEPCQESKGWPVSMSRSNGQCEVCGLLAVCYEVPSSHLPVPQRQFEADIDLDSRMRAMGLEVITGVDGHKVYQVPAGSDIEKVINDAVAAIEAGNDVRRSRADWKGLR